MSDEGVKRTRFFCDSGVTLLVKPLSPFVFQKLRDTALAKFPDPDPKPYELDYPEGVTPAIAGSKIPAEDNPDYRALKQQVENTRAEWISYAVVVMACEVEQSRTELVKQFADDRASKAQFIALPSDAWEATLAYCIVTSQAERVAITLVAESRLPLTPQEVVSGCRYFRLDIPRERIDDLVRQASRVQRENGREQQLSGG